MYDYNDWTQYLWRKAHTVLSSLTECNVSVMKELLKVFWNRFGSLSGFRIQKPGLYEDSTTAVHLRAVSEIKENTKPTNNELTVLRNSFTPSNLARCVHCENYIKE